MRYNKVNKIKVSVLCFTYNHKEYIKKALDSFLMQKTNFDYEILVHDDCSTDGTIEILKEYESKFDKIKVIYEEVNIYRKKNRREYDAMLYSVSSGEYHALCEGDDYWVDDCKLQKQADIMDSHPDCSLCLHRVDFVTEDGKLLNFRLPLKLKSGLYSSDDFMKMRIKKGEHFQTSSYFYRTCAKKDLLELTDKTLAPEFIRISLVGDQTTLNYLATKGNVYYVDETMSHYRTNSKSSVMKVFTQSPTHEIDFAKNSIAVYNSFDDFTNYKYHRLIVLNYDRNVEKIKLYSKLGENKTNSLKFSKEVIKKKYRNYFHAYNFKQRLLLVLQATLPHLYSFAKKIVKGN